MWEVKDEKNILDILVVVNMFLPQGTFLPIFSEPEIPVSKSVLAFVNGVIVLVLYGGLGFIGLKLSQKLGFADIWDLEVSIKQRFLIPALIGICIGGFFIFADTILSRFHTLGPLPHPPFPTSIVVSAIAGIGEETIFRLFFISFWVWLISYVIFKGRWKEQIFWIVTVFSALAFSFGHIPSVMLLFGFKNIKQIPPALISEILLLNGILSIFAACYFRKSGFIAPVFIHFWTDIVWHVIWGIFG